MSSLDASSTASSARKVTGFPATRLGIVGSRDYPNEVFVRGVLHGILKDYHVVVSGGARGVDTWAAEVAREIGCQVCEHKADWSRGKQAGFERNTVIVRDSDLIIAFWDGLSRGTLDTLTKANALGKVIVVVNTEGDVFSNYWKVAA